MKRLAMALWLILAVAIAIVGYVRLAPSDPARWHRMPEFAADADLGNGVMRRTEAGPDGLARLAALIEASPRTRHLAGSVAEGMVTYVTRSAVIGFPDYTTIRQDGAALEIFGRARFGRSDLGVNRARVKGWIDALQSG